MESDRESQTAHEAIAANLAALQILLARCASRSAEAAERMRCGNKNGTIGAVLGLDAVLEETRVLYCAVIVLHLTARAPGLIPRRPNSAASKFRESSAGVADPFESQAFLN